MKPPTSTKTITRLGVLTVLTQPGYLAPGVEPIDGDFRAQAEDALQQIVHGHTHVPAWKVRDRLMERSIVGGQCLGYHMPGVGPLMITGLN